MAVPTARENILNKIRQALVQPVPLPFPLSKGEAAIYQPATDELDIIFAEAFIKLQGNFIFCIDDESLCVLYFR